MRAISRDSVAHSVLRLCALTALLLTSTLAFAQAPPATSPATLTPEQAYTAALPLYKYDAQQPLAAKYEKATKFPGGRFTHLTYRSVNDVRVPALLYVPDTATKEHPAPCLVLMHGLGGNKESLGPLGQLAAANGYESLIIDEYGHGERIPKNADGTPGTPQFNLDMIGGGRQTVLDVRRGIDLISARPDVDPKRIGLIGFSLGALLGSVAAGVEPRIKATVLVSGGGDLVGILKYLADHNTVLAGHAMGSWKGTDWSMAGLLLQPAEPLNFAAHIAPRAVLMECGRQDVIIPPFAAQAFYDAASKPEDSHVQIDWYENAGHIPPLTEMAPKIQAWLKTNL